MTILNLKLSMEYLFLGVHSYLVYVGQELKADIYISSICEIFLIGLFMTGEDLVLPTLRFHVRSGNFSSCHNFFFHFEHNSLTNSSEGEC